MGLLDGLRDVAKKGRGGDTLLGHLTPGDLVIPAEAPPIVRQAALLGLASHGFNPARFLAGSKRNSVNPKTGLPEFDASAAGGDSSSGSEGDAGGFGDGGNSSVGDGGDTGNGQPGGEHSGATGPSAAAGDADAVGIGGGVSPADVAAVSATNIAPSDTTIGFNPGGALKGAFTGFATTGTPIGAVLGAITGGMTIGGLTTGQQAMAGLSNAARGAVNGMSAGNASSSIGATGPGAMGSGDGPEANAVGGVAPATLAAAATPAPLLAPARGFPSIPPFAAPTLLGSVYNPQMAANLWLARTRGLLG